MRKSLPGPTSGPPSAFDFGFNASASSGHLGCYSEGGGHGTTLVVTSAQMDQVVGTQIAGRVVT